MHVRLLRMRWGEKSPDADRPWSVAVYDERFWRTESGNGNVPDHWILMGETARQADAIGAGKAIVFVHPRGLPPQRWSGQGMVVLNGVDEDGSREHWLQWANRRNLPTMVIPGIGLNARAEWPSTYASLFKEIEQR